MSDQKDNVGYVVLYDSQGDGLRTPSWGLYVCWGEDELRDEVGRVLSEIEDDHFGLDDIVVLRIDESFNFSVTRKERVVEEIEITMGRK